MTCSDAMRLLWDYLDHVLPDAEEKEVRSHLADCMRCQPHAAFEQRLLDEISAIRPEAVELAALRNRIAAALTTLGGLEWRHD
jgi:anti-sigma factor RsiW